MQGITMDPREWRLGEARDSGVRISAAIEGTPIPMELSFDRQNSMAYVEALAPKDASGANPFALEAHTLFSHNAPGISAVAAAKGPQAALEALLSDTASIASSPTGVCRRGNMAALKKLCSDIAVASGIVGGGSITMGVPATGAKASAKLEAWKTKGRVPMPPKAKAAMESALAVAVEWAQPEGWMVRKHKDRPGRVEPREARLAPYKGDESGHSRVALASRLSKGMRKAGKEIGESPERIEAILEDLLSEG